LNCREKKYKESAVDALCIFGLMPLLLLPYFLHVFVNSQFKRMKIILVIYAAFALLALFVAIIIALFFKDDLNPLS
jgi:hypothetical protein